MFIRRTKRHCRQLGRYLDEPECRMISGRRTGTIPDPLGYGSSNRVECAEYLHSARDWPNRNMNLHPDSLHSDQPHQWIRTMSLSLEERRRTKTNSGGEHVPLVNGPFVPSGMWNDSSVFNVGGNDFAGFVSFEISSFSASSATHLYISLHSLKTDVRSFAKNIDGLNESLSEATIYVTQQSCEMSSELECSASEWECERIVAAAPIRSVSKTLPNWTLHRHGSPTGS
jgi:hypothetical protein